MNFCPSTPFVKFVIVVAVLLLVWNVPLIPAKACTEGVAELAVSVAMTFAEAVAAYATVPPNHAGSAV